VAKLGGLPPWNGAGERSMVELDEEARAPQSEARAGKQRKQQLQGIDYGPLANWLGFHLRLAQIASFQAFVSEAQEVDLSPGRFALLMLIGRNPGISQTTLSRAHGSDKSTLTPALNDLKRRGLITRGRLKSDRRSYQLALTPAGQQLLVRLTACAEKHEHNLDRIIGSRDRARFLKLLRKLNSQLR
jgi:DNA-binding MarR family transcriptional regulator